MLRGEWISASSGGSRQSVRMLSGERKTHHVTSRRAEVARAQLRFLLKRGRVALRLHFALDAAFDLFHGDDRVAFDHDRTPAEAAAAGARAGVLDPSSVRHLG